MMADLPIDLWLETQHQDNRNVIIPYVRSVEPGPVRYQISLIRQGAAGTSRIQQGGAVTLVAGEAMPLATLSSRSDQAATCEMSITVETNTHPQKSYRFDCP